MCSRNASPSVDLSELKWVCLAGSTLPITSAWPMADTPHCMKQPAVCGPYREPMGDATQLVRFAHERGEASSGALDAIIVRPPHELEVLWRTFLFDSCSSRVQSVLEKSLPHQNNEIVCGGFQLHHHHNQLDHRETPPHKLATHSLTISICRHL